MVLKGSLCLYVVIYVYLLILASEFLDAHNIFSLYLCHNQLVGDQRGHFIR